MPKQEDDLNIPRKYLKFLFLQRPLKDILFSKCLEMKIDLVALNKIPSIFSKTSK